MFQGLLAFQVSMVSSNTMYHINNRLNMMAGCTDPGIFFGGYLLFLFGQKYHLPPRLVFDIATCRGLGPVAACRRAQDLQRSFHEASLSCFVQFHVTMRLLVQSGWRWGGPSPPLEGLGGSGGVGDRGAPEERPAVGGDADAGAGRLPHGRRRRPPQVPLHRLPRPVPRRPLPPGCPSLFSHEFGG